MAKCAALDCEFLDQYQEYLDQVFTIGPDLTFPQRPQLKADPDIAGLGVFTDHLLLPMRIAETPC